jgi:hypothetical protein
MNSRKEMSVFVKAILTLQRQVRNLTRRINRISGGASTGGTITADTTISDDYTNGNFFVSSSSTISIQLPTPEVGKRFTFTVSSGQFDMLFGAGSNTIIGMVTIYDFSSATITGRFLAEGDDGASFSNCLVGSFVEFNCVSGNQWSMSGVLARL